VQKDNALHKKSYAFAIRTVNLSQYLTKEKNDIKEIISLLVSIIKKLKSNIVKK